MSEPTNNSDKVKACLEQYADFGKQVTFKVQPMPPITWNLVTLPPASITHDFYFSDHEECEECACVTEPPLCPYKLPPHDTTSEKSKS